MPAEIMERGGLRVSVQPPLVIATLARPEALNAQTPSTWCALAAVRDLVRNDIRVVILRAEGRSFSAGLDRRMLDGTGIAGEADLIELAHLDSDRLDTILAGYQCAFTWWRQSHAISVAAVQGHAVGAGFQLALACDLVVCADDAQFAMRETTLGLVPDLGGTAPLVTAVGYPRALEICGTGRWVHADEAVRLGLALVAVPAADLDAAIDDLVHALLAAPDGSLRETKALLRGAASGQVEEQLAAERAAQARRLRDLADVAGPETGHR